MARKYGLSLGRATQEKLEALKAQPIPELPHAWLGASVDLRSRMPRVYDQGQLGSCTANALCAVMQFYDPKLKGSRLFLYFCEREMEGDIAHDTGAFISDGVKALVHTGVCQESLWPYVQDRFANKPPKGCYAAARLHEARSVYSVPNTEAGFKTALQAGHPVAVGIAVYASFESQQVTASGNVPLPGDGEQPLGGFAVCAVGYDDTKRHWIMRNSWGEAWGDKGYFYLPYAYLTNPLLCSDAWCIGAVTNPRSA